MTRGTYNNVNTGQRYTFCPRHGFTALRIYLRHDQDQGPFASEDEAPGSSIQLPLLVVGNKADRASVERAHLSYAHFQAHTVSRHDLPNSLLDRKSVV